MFFRRKEKAMKDYRHPDQKILPQAVQAWWEQFLLSQPSNEQLQEEIVTNKPWKAEAAAELLRRNCLDEQCLSAIVKHVAEHSSRSLELLAYIYRMKKLKIKPLVWLGELGLTA
jgi:hypothetical protein